jgi:hypothetical protein
VPLSLRRRRRGEQHSVGVFDPIGCNMSVAWLSNLFNMDAPSQQQSDWTGTHVWTIDYADLHNRAKSQRQHWIHSDPFMIGGHEFTMMVNGNHFIKPGNEAFGVFLCPSKDLSGCLLTSFKIHLRFNGVDPLPSGMSACKDFWEEENKGGELGYNWGFQTYCSSVTHQELIDRSSPYFQQIGKTIVVIVEVRRLIIFRVYYAHLPRSCMSKYAKTLRSTFKKSSEIRTPATCARKLAMLALKTKAPRAI